MLLYYMILLNYTYTSLHVEGRVGRLRHTKNRQNRKVRTSLERPFVFPQTRTLLEGAPDVFVRIVCQI